MTQLKPPRAMEDMKGVTSFGFHNFYAGHSERNATSRLAELEQACVFSPVSPYLAA